jgi:hypothetical protein
MLKDAIATPNEVGTEYTSLPEKVASDLRSAQNHLSTSSRSRTALETILFFIYDVKLFVGRKSSSFSTEDSFRSSLGHC